MYGWDDIAGGYRRREKKYLFIIHSMYHQFQFISIYLFPILWIKNKYHQVGDYLGWK